MYNFTVHRFHSPDAARKVLREAQKLTNAALIVDRVPCPDDKHVGEYAIVCETNVSYAAKCKVDLAVNQALQMALAEALRQHSPNHSLLTIYHLKEEHLPNVRQAFILSGDDFKD